MRRPSAQLLLAACVFLLPLRAPAQESPATPNNQIVDDPSEIAKFKQSCGSLQLKTMADCAELVFTGRPVHVAVGSLAPQNGFGAGLAYVGSIKPTETWRPSWNADAVATPNGSWRAGVYFKFVHTPPFKTIVHTGKPTYKTNFSELPEHSVVNVYAQATSLNQVGFFGLGPSTTEAGRTFFGIREIIVGANVVKPLSGRWNISLLGEANGRFVDIRPSTGNDSPTIGALYTESTAPGLATQPGFLQLGESIRMRPIFWNDLVHLNYQVSYQQFFAPSNSRYSFQRFTVDLSHEFALYRSTTRFYTPRDGNGPDECAIDNGAKVPSCSINKKQVVANCENANGKDSPTCRAISRDLQGSVGIRFFYSTSITQDNHTVPFYFQPTLGGGDINGATTLSSFQDYRFRAPNVLFVRESFEHSIWGPLGLALAADEGKVALERGDFGSSPWLHSFSAGLTLRAGGFPQVFLMYAWGGGEGTHLIANMNASLLGGSARPSMY